MQSLFRIAEREGIGIYYGFFPSCRACSVPSAIALDAGLTESEEKVCLAHELGHCLTGAFYTVRSSALDRARCERKAEKWAIKKLVPVRELERALKAGYQPYEIAEMLGVTEEFLRKAVIYYQTTERIRDSR